MDYMELRQKNLGPEETTLIYCADSDVIFQILLLNFF
jgi:hypothetical protein